MNEKKAFFIHDVCLTALFILGNTVISMPFLQNRPDSFLVFLAAGIFSLLLLPLLNKCIAFLINKETVFNKAKPIFFLLFCLFALISVLLAAACAKDYIGFTKASVLPDCPKWLLSLIFAVVLYVFSVSENHSISKFSLIFSVIIAIILLLFFILSFGHFNFRNIFPFQFSLSKSFITSALKYVVKIFLPVSIPIAYISLSQASPNSKKILLGSLLGFVLLGVSLANALLIFGYETCADMSFPYADAISTVTVGSLFTRMDGFAYFVFFICSLLKATVCLKCAYFLLQKFGFKLRKSFLGVCVGSVFIFSFV